MIPGGTITGAGTLMLYGTLGGFLKIVRGTREQCEEGREGMVVLHHTMEPKDPPQCAFSAVQM